MTTIDLTAEGPCDAPEPHWDGGIPWCSPACPHYVSMPEVSPCELGGLEASTRASGRVCTPTVQALGRAVQGKRLPVWARPPEGGA